MDSSFVQILPGETVLSERGERLSENRGWATAELLKADVDQIEMRVAIDEDEGDQITIELSKYHMQNTETGRAFHVDIVVRLDREDAERLQAYLGFLLSLRL